MIIDLLPRFFSVCSSSCPIQLGQPNRRLGQEKDLDSWAWYALSHSLDLCPNPSQTWLAALSLSPVPWSRTRTHTPAKDHTPVAPPKLSSVSQNIPTRSHNLASASPFSDEAGRSSSQVRNEYRAEILPCFMRSFSETHIVSKVLAHRVHHRTLK